MFRDRVKAFVHRRLFTVGTDEVLEAYRRTEHALGNLEKSIDQRKAIEDASWPHSFSLFFHTLLEETGRIPLWQEFWAACWEGRFRPHFRDLIDDLLRLEAKNNKVHSSELEISNMAKEHSAHWRLGKYYYSALRELYLQAALREWWGIEIKYHLIADVRFFIDGWTNSGTLLCLRLPNDFESRKNGPEKYAAAGINVFRVGAQWGRRGHLWLPTNEHVNEVAANIRAVENK